MNDESRFHELPADLPEPADDGAANHLEGTTWPETLVGLVPDGKVLLPEAFGSRAVLFIYPRTGTPGEPLIPGWDDIPGARGCTPQNCAYREASGGFERAGVRVFGLSSQAPDQQAAFHEREALPYPLLNDSRLVLADRIGLPTFSVHGMNLYKRITMVITDGKIEKVFYPVFPPDQDAANVLTWLT